MFGDLPEVYVLPAPSQMAQVARVGPWWYNTNYHSSLGMTPYQALFKHVPPKYLVVNLGTKASPTMQEWGKE